ncbi:hypothetical protein [Neochlamydia sp. S13]|uniref:hypothetical protein n=1 Tax=Neochlamydia sp. S13 TaxID=1353976 RepID=UPI0005A7E4DA|nr:hypothetical protein [Neochlamydia sp. S13]BBI17618.1 hypothetical protein NCS13_1_1423 [Neochlamydia sp. S13]
MDAPMSIASESIHLFSRMFSEEVDQQKQRFHGRMDSKMKICKAYEEYEDLVKSNCEIMLAEIKIEDDVECYAKTIETQRERNVLALTGIFNKALTIIEVPSERIIAEMPKLKEYESKEEDGNQSLNKESIDTPIKAITSAFAKFDKISQRFAEKCKAFRLTSIFKGYTGSNSPTVASQFLEIERLNQLHHDEYHQPCVSWRAVYLGEEKRNNYSSFLKFNHQYGQEYLKLNRTLQKLSTDVVVELSEWEEIMRESLLNMEESHRKFATQAIEAMLIKINIEQDNQKYAKIINVYLDIIKLSGEMGLDGFASLHERMYKLRDDHIKDQIAIIEKILEVQKILKLQENENISITLKNEIKINATERENLIRHFKENASPCGRIAPHRMARFESELEALAWSIERKTWSLNENDKHLHHIAKEEQFMKNCVDILQQIRLQFNLHI